MTTPALSAIAIEMLRRGQVVRFENVYVIYGNGTKWGPISRNALAAEIQAGRVQIYGTLLQDVETGEVHPISLFTDLTSLAPKTLLNTVIPRNGYALASYYIAIFSPLGLFICMAPALIMGIASVLLGWKGLRVCEEQPECGGRKHSWFGIIFGGIIGLIAFAFCTLFAVALIMERM